MAHFLMSPECYTKIFQEGDLVNVDCLQRIVANLLGYAIIVGATIFKIPQILKIFQNKSADGVSILTYLLELVVLIISLGSSIAKDAPFSTYGESVFILIQDLVIVLQIAYYSRFSIFSTVAVGGVFAAYSYVFCLTKLVPLSFWDPLQVVNILILIVSRLPQIAANYKSKDVAQQSLITWGMNFLGSAARTFTTYKLRPDDIIMFGGFLIAALLNGIISFQIIRFSKKGEDKKGEKKGDKKGEKKTAPKVGVAKKTNSKKDN